MGAGLLVGLSVAAGSTPPADAAAAARIVFSGDRAQPAVALTFDDGNDPTQLRLIFNTLRAAHVPATFFPFAQAMTFAPALWRTVAAAGYPIGNHTVSHPDLLRVSDATLRSEITGATAEIQAITGRAPIPVFRPPFGAWDARVAAAASSAGYPTMLLWNVDPRDWSGIPAPVIVQRVLAQTRDGSVVLLHVGPYHTAAALPSIIAGLARRSFRFVTVPQLLAGDLHGAVVLSASQIAALTSVSSAPGSMARPSRDDTRSRSTPANLARLDRAGVGGLGTPADQPVQPLVVASHSVQALPEADRVTVAVLMMIAAAILAVLVRATKRPMRRDEGT